VNPTNNVTDIQDFLTRVLPWPTDDELGFCNLHWSHPDKNEPGKKVWLGRPFRSPTELIGMARWIVQNVAKADIYFCLSRQQLTGTNKKGKTIALRSTANASSLKSIWLDIDVKEPPAGYASLEEALLRFNEFRVKFKLPPPSALVASGGGVHVYWVSKTPLTPAQWRPYAEGLKAAAMQFDLRCDYAVTTDSARILRMPGTFNHKTTEPRPVKILELS